MKESLEIKVCPYSRTASLCFRGLSYFFLFVVLLGLSVEVFGYLTGKNYFVPSLRYILITCFLTKLTFGIAALGVITHRRWSVYLAKITGTWMLVISWAAACDALYETYYYLLYLNCELVSSSLPLELEYVVSLPWPMIFVFRLLFVFLLALYIWAAVKVTKEQANSSSFESKPTNTKVKSSARLLTVAICAVALGLGLRWMDNLVSLQIYGTLIGGYITILGVILGIVWQLLSPRHFFTGAAIGASLILYICHPVGMSVFISILQWLPISVFIILSMRRDTCRFNVRVVAILVPAVLMSCHYIVSINATLHFSAYHKPMAKRPADFPEYMQPQPNVANVSYKSGDPLQLRYAAIEPYPATQTIQYIDTILESAGWMKMDYLLFAPEIPSGHLQGWRESPQELHKYSWNSFWINKDEEIMLVLLDYLSNSNEDKSPPEELQVCISRYSPSDEIKTMIARYRDLHAMGQ